MKPEYDFSRGERGNFLVRSRASFADLFKR